MNLLTVFVFVHLARCFDVVPLLVASHRLVPGLKNELAATNTGHRHNGAEVTNMLKKLVTQCSSDEYIILDIPGVNYRDLNDAAASNWPFLTRYLSMSSTVVGLSFVNDYIDLDYLQQYISTTCEAEVMVANVEDDNSINYIDAKPRVINIRFDELPTDEDERRARIVANDDFIRRIIRKLPSPHYTIVLTSSKRSQIHPVPPVAMDENPSMFGLFNTITNSPHRQAEVEFNDMYKSVEPVWYQDRNTNHRYLENRKKDVVQFLDYELWTKNEQLVMTLLVMMVTVGMIRVKQLFGWVFGKQKSE